MPELGRHEDERGVIQDLLLTPLDGVTRISTKQGAVRGNHVHKRTTQWTYIVSGRLLVVTQGGETRKRHTLGPGELFCDQPGIAHAWQAITDCEVLVFTRGPRSGEDYESDTARLTVPLIKPDV